MRLPGVSMRISSSASQTLFPFHPSNQTTAQERRRLTAVEAGANLFSGGETVSTEAVVAGMHAGCHLSAIGWK
jgi:hypothetical protein